VIEKQGREREAGGSGREIAQPDLMINLGPSRDIQAYIVVVLSLPRVSVRQAERPLNAESGRELRNASDFKEPD
jgi:hypothetical protein